MPHQPLGMRGSTSHTKQIPATPTHRHFHITLYTFTMDLVHQDKALAENFITRSCQRIELPNQPRSCLGQGHLSHAQAARQQCAPCGAWRHPRQWLQPGGRVHRRQSSAVCKQCIECRQTEKRDSGGGNIPEQNTSRCPPHTRSIVGANLNQYKQEEQKNT